MFKMGTIIFVLIALIAVASAKPYSNRHRGYHNHNVGYRNPSDLELQRYAAKLLHYHFHHHVHDHDHDEDHDDEDDDDNDNEEEDDDDHEHTNFFDHYRHQTFFQHPPHPQYTGQHRHPQKHRPQQNFDHYHHRHHPQHYHYVVRPVLEKIPDRPHKNTWTYDKHHEQVLQQGLLSKPDVTKKAPVGPVLKKTTVQSTSSPKPHTHKQITKAMSKPTEDTTTTTTIPTTTTTTVKSQNSTASSEKPVNKQQKEKSKPFSETYYRIWFNKGE